MDTRPRTPGPGPRAPAPRTRLAGVTRAYMGQTQIWPRIGPISVPRPRTGSIFGETETRKQSFGVPGPLGAKLGDFGLGGWGTHACYSLPRFLQPPRATALK